MKAGINRISVLATGMVAALLFCGQLVAGEFTADLVISMPGQDDTLKMYVSGYSYRLEKLEGNNKLLLFRTKGATTALNPEEKEYKLFEGTDENMYNPFAAWENMANDMEARGGDNETINGYECKKYLYNYKGSDDVVFERWLSPKLKFVIKQKILSSGGDAVMELINIKEETIDANLFKIPEDYSAALDPRDLPVPIPDWAQDLGSIPVVKPPFEKMMATGEMVRIKTEAGKSIWVRGNSTSEAEAKAKAIPFKDGRPIEELTMYNNIAMKGMICSRRHETAAEVDFVVIHVEQGEVKVEAKLVEMYEKSVKAGREFGVSLNPSDNIEVRLVNAIDGESEVTWDMLKNDEVQNAEYTKYRTENFNKKNEFFRGTFSPDGDQIVFKVVKGEVIIKLGQYDTFKY